MKRSISIFFAVAAFLFCCAGCSSKTEEAKKPLIGVSMQNRTSTITQLQADAMTAKFPDCEVQVASAEDSVSNQIQQLQNFILMGAEMLVVLPTQIEALEDTLLEAKKAGIKVVVSGSTGNISKDAYDAVTKSDEFLIGCYVASVANTYVTENFDPQGDWETVFMPSSISDESKLRSLGMKQILEPYLKNMEGQYVDAMGTVVDESRKVPNPVYNKMVASRPYHEVELDIKTDTRSGVANALTSYPKARLFICYFSPASTAGSQYVMDTYRLEQAKEFGFFSGGVMGDEDSFMIGSVFYKAGTPGCFYGACQFGGGDAAATLANLSHKVMYGKAGVDYGKSNPETIGAFYAVPADKNNGVAAVVVLPNDSPTVKSFTYKELLSHPDLIVHWDAKNGFSKTPADAPKPEAMPAPPAPKPAAAGGSSEAAAPKPAPAPQQAGAPAPAPPKSSGSTVSSPQSYTNDYKGPMGVMKVQFDFLPDGSCKFYLPGHPMIKDVYSGKYSISGSNVAITGLINDDKSSQFVRPGLWSFIDPATGNSKVTVNSATGEFSY